MQAHKLGWVLTLVVAAGSANAIRVADEAAPKPETAREATPAAPGIAAAAAADDSASLREGVIASISADGASVEIAGTTFKVVSGRTKVFRQGRAVSTGQLQKGSKVKFTLAPGGVDRTTLGVVYVP